MLILLYIRHYSYCVFNINSNSNFPLAVAMVDIPKDCVLQWAGHAGYITERFSGLLARQALVDVTLICDEQKLRVHKLVLASNSIYFEVCIEILEYVLPTSCCHL